MRAVHGRSPWPAVAVLLMVVGCGGSDTVVSLSSAASGPPLGTAPSDNPETVVSLSPAAPGQPPGTAPSDDPDIVVSLNYVAQGWPFKMAPWFRPGSGPRLRAEAPRQMRNVPSRADATRYWSELQLGSPERPNRFVLLVDDTRPEPVRMYLDANQNGDLSDDPGPLDNQGTGAFARAIDLKLSYPGVPDPQAYRIWFFINDHNWKTRTCSFYSRCHRRGTLAVGGRTLTLVLFDNPADGDYSNELLVVDLNGSGKVDADEEFEPGEVIGDTQLKLKFISPAGDHVVLTRVR